MLRLLKFMAILALLWTGWWFLANLGMQRGLEGWFAARKAEGWQAEVTDIQQQGFPFQLHTRLIGPQIADPHTGVAMELDHLDIQAPAWWPGYMTLTVPETPVLLASPLARNYLTMQESRAALRLHPGSTLQLQSMVAGSRAWQLDGDAGTLLSGDGASVSLSQSPDMPDSYRLGFDALNVTPGDAWRSALRLPADWPQAFETLSASMTVLFDRPWDRSALISRRPQPVVVSLHRADAIWGALRFRAVGDLVISPLGVPDGTLSLKAENWRGMLDIAQSGGTLKPAMRFQLEAILGALARLTGRTDDLDIDVTFKDGQTSVGPISLGPAPKIALR